MRLLCLNQFVPPDPAPTAKLLGELRELLIPHGWDVDMIGCTRSYRDHRGRGWRRWLGELMAHARLLWKGVFSQRPDVVLCLSDPPGLPFTAALVARRWRVPLAHWAMDVYPQVAAALGEVSPSGLIFRTVNAAMQSAYRRCGVIACLDEDMVDAVGLRHDQRVFVCPPWAPRDLVLPAKVAPPETSRGRLHWIYSGNLGRAHDFATLLHAQKILETAGTPYDLVFQGGGQAREEAMRLAEELGLEHCQWTEYVPPCRLVESLLQAHVLVATQRSEARGLVWPSKLAVMQHLPRPMVWVGPNVGSIARTLRTAGGLSGIFSPGDSVALARWLQDNFTAIRDSAMLPWTQDHLKAAWIEQVEDSATQWHRHLSQLVPRADVSALQPA